MSGLSGTKTDDFINAAKARGEAALRCWAPAALLVAGSVRLRRHRGGFGTERVR